MTTYTEFLSGMRHYMATLVTEADQKLTTLEGANNVDPVVLADAIKRYQHYSCLVQLIDMHLPDAHETANESPAQAWDRYVAKITQLGHVSRSIINNPDLAGAKEVVVAVRNVPLVD